MKLQKFTSAVLLSALVLGVTAPAAFAAEEALSIPGKATIQYTENDESDDKGTGNVTDPENPDKKVEVDEDNGSNNNDKKGTLRVDFLSNLKFGETKITTSAGEYYATPTVATTVNSDGSEGVKVDRGNFINVTDQRADGTPKGWKLSAEVTKAFSNGTVALDGAELTYTLPYVSSTQKAVNFPTAVPTATLSATSGSTLMATADAGKGWGAYSIEYGRPSLDADGKVVEDGSGVTPATMAEAVKLNVPANTPLDITSAYVAEITWTIAELTE
ncbi:WxL domain-containing protein [Vagococcus salmoninarum]|uniref:WxL domain-containing protein n=1 Tax=Vagococcus salmoninarum TaxID=2739 RepID=UPI0028D44640|nr:WxL domain-containing protein [Vagococcus salmoninarum]